MWLHDWDPQFRSLKCNNAIPQVVGRSGLEREMLQSDLCCCKGAGTNLPLHAVPVHVLLVQLGLLTPSRRVHFAWM